MHILNVMFGCGLGGIEQSFVDYCEAIKLTGNKASALIHPDAKIKESLLKVGINITGVKNCGHWDFFAKSYINKIVKQLNPDAIIAHGNRAARLTKYAAAKNKCPLITVTHNYNLKHLVGVDAVFAITEDLKQKAIEAGQAEASIYKIPNMIRFANQPERRENFNKPPVIGTMGRFVKKKGFDVFINSLAKLKEEGIEFNAIIGGSGEEDDSLKRLSNSNGLSENLEFIGWVEDKEKFFGDIDIFCLPSLHEPFGIILLEAFAAGVPVITSASEGPIEIASDKHDALITAVGDSEAMAGAIKMLTENQKLAKDLSQNALQTVKKYDIESVGQQICSAVNSII